VLYPAERTFLPGAALSLWAGADRHAGDEFLIARQFLQSKKGRRYDSGSVVCVDRDFPAVRVHDRGEGQRRFPLEG
jgi:hypothetical protein